MRKIVVDEKHGLVVNTDVVGKSNDLEQFAEQINQANEIMGKNCEVACADAGYANTEELKKIDGQGIIAHSFFLFDKANFRYDAEKDCYICPEGHPLGNRE